MTSGDFVTVSPAHVEVALRKYLVDRGYRHRTDESEDFYATEAAAMYAALVAAVVPARQRPPTPAV